MSRLLLSTKKLCVRAFLKVYKNYNLKFINFKLKYRLKHEKQLFYTAFGVLPTQNGGKKSDNQIYFLCASIEKKSIRSEIIYSKYPCITHVN